MCYSTGVVIALRSSSQQIAKFAPWNLDFMKQRFYCMCSMIFIVVCRAEYNISWATLQLHLVCCYRTS